MGHTLTLESARPGVCCYDSRQSDGQSPEAVAAHVVSHRDTSRSEDPWSRFIGAFNSQGIDGLNHHDAYLGRAGAEHPDARALSQALRGLIFLPIPLLGTSCRPSQV